MNKKMFKGKFKVGRIVGFFLLCFLMGWLLLFCCYWKKLDDEWVVRCGNHKISSGEYVFLLNQKIMEVSSKLFKTNEMSFEPKKLDYKKLEQSRMGPQSKKTFDWIEDEAKDMAEKFLLARMSFEGGNYENDPRFKMMVDRELPDEQDWDDVFSGYDKQLSAIKTGVSKQTMFKYVVDDVVKNKFVLSESFGPGKPKDFSGDIPEYIKNNFVKYKIVSVLKNESYPGYSKQNDSKGGSKLEKEEGVKTPKELADKYMKEINDGGKTLDEIGSSYNEKFGGMGKKTEVPVKISYLHESEYVHDFISKEYKDMILQVEVDKPPILKEDGAAYHIIQRFDLNEDDVKAQDTLARKILKDQKTKEFYYEIKNGLKEPIEFNNKVLKKYSPSKQAKKFIKNNPVIEKQF